LRRSTSPSAGGATSPLVDQNRGMADEPPSILAGFARVRIPPDEAAAIAALVVESMLIAWNRRRVGLSARMYRARRELAVAFESEGGVKTLLYSSLARRRQAAPAPAGYRSRRALARRG
jgi:hypothetical protein